MARAAIIKPSLDGAEFILSGRSSQKLTEPCEVGITGRIARRTGRIKIIALLVGVPKFDQRAAHGIPGAVQDAPADVGDNARRDGQVVIQLDQVIVFIKRNVVSQRVVGPLGHDRRCRECFGEISGQSEPGRGECQAFEKAATIDRNIENSGLCGFRGFRFHRSSVFRFVGPLFCALIKFAYVPSVIGLTRPSGDGDPRSMNVDFIFI